jgi:hypothetical protein
MIRRSEIVPAALEHSLLAARILAGLNELEANRRTPFAESALDSAVEFFDSILKGSSFTRNREVAERSYECALAFGEAIQVIDRLPVTPDEKNEPARFVQLLHDKAVSIRKQPPADQNDLKVLASFFQLLRDIALVGDPQVYERVSYGE